MRVVWLAVAVCILANGPSFADERKYRCKDFVADFMSVPEGRRLDPDKDIYLSRSAGFIFGVYYAITGEDIDSADDSGVAAFEKAVAGECSASPSERVPVAVLKVARSLKSSGIQSQTKPTTSDDGRYEVISMTDLKLDIAQMKGKRVQVTGRLQTMGEMAMISSERFDTNPIFIEYKDLPREQRKQILETCSSGCEVTAKAKVATVLFNNGLVAEDLKFE